MRNLWAPCLLFGVASCLSIGCGFVLKNPSAEVPSVTCSANPTALPQGGNALITALAFSPTNSPLQLRFSASAGILQVKGSSALLSVPSSVTGNVTVSCQAIDASGQTGSTTTTINILSAVPVTPPFPVTTTLTASPNPVASGTAVTLTSTVSSASGIPIGAITFTDGATDVGVVPISAGGEATFKISTLAAGTHTIGAKFSGSSAYAASDSAPLSLTVLPPGVPPGTTPLPVTTTLTASPNPVASGTAVTLTSAVSSASGVPTGTIIFTDGGTTIGLVPVSAGGNAIFKISTLAVGTHTIGAKFSGSSTYPYSVSAPLSLIVSATEVPPVITCSVAPSSINQGVSATITGSASSPSGSPVVISYSSSEGSLRADGDSAVFDSAGATPGKVSISCTATDGDGQTATSTTSLWINADTGEKALSAYTFSDSVGVNVHLHYGNTPYVTEFTNFLNSITALGVRHYRNGIDSHAYPWEYTNAEALASKGIKADWLIDVHDSAQNINAIYANAPDSIEEFEGPNEDDVNVGPVTASFSALLYDTVRANPATSKIPIYATTFAQLSSIAQQGSLTPYVDDGNMHDYYYPRNPETPSYGGSFFNCGNYGSMAFNTCVAQVTAPGLPVVSTETGYISGTQSDEVIGRYITRTLFKHLQLGVFRTYIYEFLDETNSPGYGLVRGDFTPKPAYTAVKNLITLFDNPAFGSPGSFDFSLTGQTANVEHVLFQKSDGTFLLAIWLGVPSANTISPYQTYSIPPQTVAITTRTPVGAATSFVLDDEGAISSQSIPTQNETTTISITDRITIVAFSPATR